MSRLVCTYNLRSTTAQRAELYCLLAVNVGSSYSTVAKFIVPDWRDKVSSGIGLSYRPASLHWLAGRYICRAGVNCIPQSGTMNLATVRADVIAFYTRYEVKDLGRTAPCQSRILGRYWDKWLKGAQV